MEWTKENSKSAIIEGWDLYHTEGSVDGDRQVQRNDEQHLLEDDHQAWVIVNKGVEPHHLKAKQILKRENLKEYKRIENSIYEK